MGATTYPLMAGFAGGSVETGQAEVEYVPTALSGPPGATSRD